MWFYYEFLYNRFSVLFSFSSSFWGKPYMLQISLTCYQIAQEHPPPEVQQCFRFPQVCVAV